MRPLADIRAYRLSKAMPTALDAPDAKLDPAEKSFVANMREHGWFRTGVFHDEEGPGFSYTTGFWLKMQRPELIIFSIKDEIAHDVFWDLFRRAGQGHELVIGKRTDDVFANLPAYVFPVAKRHYADHLGWCRWFYGNDEFPCLQIVWPDHAGVFPWQSGFDPEFQPDQPDLTDEGWAAEVKD